MLKINQQSKLNEPVYGTLLKSEPFEVNINIETLDRDIKRIEKQLKAAKNKYNIANLKYILNYLNKTRNKIKDGVLELCWDLKDNKLASYPTEIKTHPEYMIDASEYIELHNEKMIIFDFIDIVNILSFEYIYRDLGYSHKDVEDILDKLGITGTVSSKIIIDFFKSEDLNPYLLSKQSRIEDSPHINKESHKIKNYYNTEEFSTESYHEVVVNSVKITLDIIASELYKKFVKLDANTKLVSIGETTIVFNVSDEIELDLADICSDISLRIFGRNFEVIPKMTIL